MYIIQKCPGDQIKLGRKGEYNARRIALDLSAWQTRYGDNDTVQLIYQRPGDATPYPVTLTREDHLAIWTVAATDTANSGNSGRAELRYYIDDALVKSAISQVVVEPSLGEPGDAPDEEQQSWLEQAVQAGSTAQNSAANAANSAQSAQTSAETAATSAGAAEASAQNAAASAVDAQNAAIQAANSAQTAADEVNAAMDTLVDDTIVDSETLWSSEKIINFLCENSGKSYSGSSSSSGGTVSINPVAGSLLRVGVDIDANPKPWKTPKPTSSNPLRGWSSVSLTNTANTNTASYNIDFGCTVYGGTLNTATGLLTITHKIQYFDGSEDWQTVNDGSAYHPVLTIDGISPNPDRTNRNENCSHYEFRTGEAIDGHTTGICTTGDGIEIYNPSYTQEDPTAWKECLAALNTAGDPLHVVVQLNEPYTLQVEPAHIIAFSGSNSLKCSIGNFDVSWMQDFRYEMQQLEDKVSQLKKDMSQLKTDVNQLKSDVAALQG